MLGLQGPAHRNEGTDRDLEIEGRRTSLGARYRGLLAELAQLCGQLVVHLVGRRDCAR